ncbi:hypothetical protein [Streptomyces sp. TE33382]
MANVPARLFTSALRLPPVIAIRNQATSQSPWATYSTVAFATLGQWAKEASMPIYWPTDIAELVSETMMVRQ